MKGRALVLDLPELLNEGHDRLGTDVVSLLFGLTALIVGVVAMVWASYQTQIQSLKPSASCALLIATCVMSFFGMVKTTDEAFHPGQFDRAYVASEIQDWAKSRYGVDITEKQALSLIGEMSRAMSSRHVDSKITGDILTDGRTVQYAIDTSGRLMLVNTNELPIRDDV